MDPVVAVELDFGVHFNGFIAPLAMGSELCTFATTGQVVAVMVTVRKFFLLRRIRMHEYGGPEIKPVRSAMIGILNFILIL